MGQENSKAAGLKLRPSGEVGAGLTKAKGAAHRQREQHVNPVLGGNKSARKESAGRFEIILFLPALPSSKFQKFLAFIQLISIIAIGMSANYGLHTILSIMCGLFHFLLRQIAETGTTTPLCR